jgi:nucleoid DNA-binding protein
MTKNDLIRSVQDRVKDCLAKDVAIGVNIFFAALTDTLKRGERIDIRGFGNFSVRRRRARAARNPQNGAPVQLEVRRTPFFKVGRELQRRINTPE